MIGGKQDAGAFQRESRVVGGMAGRQHGSDRPAVARCPRIVGQGNVGPEIEVGAGVEPVVFSRAQGTLLTDLGYEIVEDRDTNTGSTQLPRYRLGRLGAAGAGGR